MEKYLSSQIFNKKQHQNFLMSQRQLLIKRFEVIIANKQCQIITYDDGSTYKGQFNQEGLRDGFGMLSSADGSAYLGKWKNDIHHQYGTYIYSDGQRYQGQIYEGMKEGQGTMYYLNGDVYSGEWSEDCKQGQGQIKYADAGRFQGEWKENKRYGQGSYFKSGIKPIATGQWDGQNFIKGTVKLQNYQGGWQNNGPNGEGTYRYEDGSQYSGTWCNGQKEGYGRFFFTNGDVYQGYFRCGLKHGKGSYKYSSGDVYQGQYYNDYKHGDGRIRFMNGDEYSGQWDKDLFHGSGKYIFNTKQLLQGIFYFGRYQGNDLMSNKIINGQTNNISSGLPNNSQIGQQNTFFKLQKQKSQINSNLYSPIIIQKDYRMVKGKSNTSSFITNKNTSHIKLQRS